MEPPKQNSNRSVLNKHIKISSLVSEIQDERGNGFTNLQHSRKEMFDSAFFDMHDYHIPYTSTIVNDNVKLSQVTSLNQEPNASLLKLMRARSLKNIKDAKPIQVVDKTSNDLTQNIVRLKVQEMTFKYKTKIGCLLKQINISGEQMNKFNKIAKTEEIIDFLSQKVRDKMIKMQLHETNFLKSKSNQIQVNNEYEIERQLLKKKLQQKQNIEKQLKIKLKENNAQTKGLLNQLSQKEQEISLRMDQVYQQKTLLCEQQKLISRLQETCNSLQLMNEKSINKLSTQSNDMIILNKQIQEQNIQLSQKINELKDQISQQKQKQLKLIQINKHLNDQIIRWRQRYQDGKAIQLEQLNNNDGNLPSTPNLSIPQVRKKNSSISLGSSGFGNCQTAITKNNSSTPIQIENMRLQTKIHQLQKKNKQLSRDILNYSSIKQKYQEKLALMGEKKYNFTQGMDGNKNEYIKQNQVDIYKIQLQNHYKRKIEEVVKEWKQKLYEIVHKYQDQLQLTKEQVSKLKIQKIEMQKKIYVLANQKCIFQTKLIQKDREIYQFKMITNSNSLNSPIKSIKDDTISNSIIINEQQAQKMINSPLRTTGSANYLVPKTENIETEKTPEMVTGENSS